jgi:RNA polymerase sigma factor FliA
MAFSHVAIYEAEHESAEARRERLILENMPQVRYLAHRIYERLPASFCLEDLISAGIVGLISAIDSFESDRGLKLSTYAGYRIRGAIMDSIRGADGMRPSHRRQMKLIQSAIRQLEQRLGRAPSEEEIVGELGTSVDEYRATLLENQAVKIGSLDAVPANTQDITFVYYLADRSEDQPGQKFEREQLQRIIADGIRRMPLLERQVLSLYYVEGLNLREIGDMMKLHNSRISQIKTQAILRLRVMLEKKWPGAKGTPIP